MILSWASPFNSRPTFKPPLSNACDKITVLNLVWRINSPYTAWNITICHQAIYDSGSEIWGRSDCETVKRIQLKFCSRLLGVGSTIITCI